MALNLKSSASEDGNADIQAIMNDIASLLSMALQNCITLVE